MILWKHIHYNPATRITTLGEDWKEPYVISETQPDPTYSDVSDNVVHWDYAYNYGAIDKDYLVNRDCIIIGMSNKTWALMTSEDKYTAIDYFAKESSKDDTTANTEKVLFLMGTGLTQEQAQGYLLQAYAKHHTKEKQACLARATSELIDIVIGKYIPISDAADFVKVIGNLYNLYVTQGIKGINDGLAGEGLFDFIESTVGTAYETAGLAQQGYVLNTGDYPSFVSELMDILRNGNY